MRAVAQDTKSGGVDMFIPRWGVEYRLHRDPAHRDSFQRSLGIIFDELELTERSMRIEVFPNVPRAMGLGGSAAMAVAVIRALDQHYQLGLSDEEINALAFRCEEVAHGSASGIDNTVDINVTKPTQMYGQCNNICGEYHAYMRFLVDVMTPAAYNAWYAQQAPNSTTTAGVTSNS